jgi:hypothetical protein
MSSENAHPEGFLRVGVFLSTWPIPNQSDSHSTARIGHNGNPTRLNRRFLGGSR